MFLVESGTPGRVQLPVLFRREVRFVSGGGCFWFAIHSACSASLSHSRTSSSKPALRVGSRVSCPRCSAGLACSRYHCALDSMPIEHPRTKAVPGTSRTAAALFRWTLGFSPAPSTVQGQGTPPSGPLPWRGSATPCVSLKLFSSLSTKIANSSRWRDRWLRSALDRAAAQERGAQRFGFDIAAASRTAAITEAAALWPFVPFD